MTDASTDQVGLFLRPTIVRPTIVENLGTNKNDPVVFPKRRGLGARGPSHPASYPIPGPHDRASYRMGRRAGRGGVVGEGVLHSSQGPLLRPLLTRHFRSRRVSSQKFEGGPIRPFVPSVFYRRLSRSQFGTARVWSSRKTSSPPGRPT